VNPKMSYDYYRTLIGNPMLEVETTGHCGRVTTRNGRNVLESTNITSSVSQNRAR